MSDVISYASATGSLYKAQLLDYYYTRRANSAIGSGTRFQMMKAYWGKSDLVKQNPAGGCSLDDIPTNFTNENLLDKFAECDLICTPQGATITVNIVLPESSLPENTVYDFNTLTLVDDDGAAFAVLCAQQDSIYKGKVYSILLTIEQKASGA
jgi:hypothetical protein